MPYFCHGFCFVVSISAGIGDERLWWGAVDLNKAFVRTRKVISLAVPYWILGLPYSSDRNRRAGQAEGVQSGLQRPAWRPVRPPFQIRKYPDGELWEEIGDELNWLWYDLFRQTLCWGVSVLKAALGMSSWAGSNLIAAD